MLHTLMHTFTSEFRRNSPRISIGANVVFGAHYVSSVLASPAWIARTIHCGKVRCGRGAGPLLPRCTASDSVPPNWDTMPTIAPCMVTMGLPDVPPSMPSGKLAQRMHDVGVACFAVPTSHVPWCV